MDIEKKYLGMKEIAAILGLHDQTIMKMTRRGMPYLQMGRQKKFVLADVEAWFAAGGNDRSRTDLVEKFAGKKRGARK
jgi:excisionase family DNA binding protein